MGMCHIDLGKWDMVNHRYVARVENLNLSVEQRLDLPVDKIDFDLFPKKNKKETKKEIKAMELEREGMEAEIADLEAK